MNFSTKAGKYICVLYMNGLSFIPEKNDMLILIHAEALLIKEISWGPFQP